MIEVLEYFLIKVMTILHYLKFSVLEDFDIQKVRERKVIDYFKYLIFKVLDSLSKTSCPLKYFNKYVII